MIKTKLIDKPDNFKVYHKLSETEHDFKVGMRQAFFEVGASHKRKANTETLRKPRAGRVYRVRSRSSGRLRNHRSSRPGEYHANMFGDLRRSIGFQIRGHDRMEFGYGAEAKRQAPDYAKMVEFGTFKMKARPTLGNTIIAEVRNTEHYLGEIVIKRLIEQ